MAENPAFTETGIRICEVRDFHGGQMPVEHALAWEGYIAALLEWNLIKPHEYERLFRLLPKTPDSPALSIFLGPEGAREQIERRSAQQ